MCVFGQSNLPAVEVMGLDRMSGPWMTACRIASCMPAACPESIDVPAILMRCPAADTAGAAAWHATHLSKPVGCYVDMQSTGYVGVASAVAPAEPAHLKALLALAGHDKQRAVVACKQHKTIQPVQVGINLALSMTCGEVAGCPAVQCSSHSHWLAATSLLSPGTVQGWQLCLLHDCPC